jgi:Ni,Fe-hydrogenase I large subunit
MDKSKFLDNLDKFKNDKDFLILIKDKIEKYINNDDLDNFITNQLDNVKSEINYYAKFYQFNYILDFNQLNNILKNKKKINKSIIQKLIDFYQDLIDEIRYISPEIYNINFIINDFKNFFLSLYNKTNNKFLLNFYNNM